MLTILLLGCCKFKISNQMWIVPQILITHLYEKNRSGWNESPRDYDMAY